MKILSYDGLRFRPGIFRVRDTINHNTWGTLIDARKQTPRT